MAQYGGYNRDRNQPLRRDCGHKVTEDCFICTYCGECQENLSDEDVCARCRSLIGDDDFVR